MMTDASLYGYSLDDFREEAKDLLARAEGALADIRETPDDQGKVNALFRVIHSLKGSAAYAGLADVTDFAHLYESLLGDLRQKKNEVDQDTLNILIRARDYLDDLISQPKKVESQRIDLASGNPMEQLKSILKGRRESGEVPPGPSLEDTEPVFENPPYPEEIDTQPSVVEDKKASQDPDLMGQNDVIRITITNDLKVLYSTLKENSTDGSTIDKYLTKLENAALWAFGGESGALIKSIEEMKAIAAESVGPEELLQLRRRFNSLAVAIKNELSLLDGPEKKSEKKGEAKPDVNVEEGSGEDEKNKISSDEIRGASKDEIVRLSLSRNLETLSDLAGEDSPDLSQVRKVLGRLNDLNRWAFNDNEAIIASIRGVEDILMRPYDDAAARELKARAYSVIPLFTAMLENQGTEGGPHRKEAKEAVPAVAAQDSHARPTNEFLFNEKKAVMGLKPAPPTSGSTIRVRTEDVESLILTVAELTGLSPKDLERLQAQALQLRMIPVGELFSRFRKVVRDLSEELGKDMEIEISGESVKLDKVIADRLNEPIMHMVRNAAGHGLETREERSQAGKSHSGLIKLNAYHEGGYVIIEVSDNGRGISLEKVRERGMKMGLIKADAGRDLSEKALLDLIFMPGFSTSEGADTVSGRGVGMDVVKDVITSLQGSVAIETKEGVGTIFRLQLPLTLAIIKGMVLQHGGNRIALPSSFVDKVITMTEEELGNATIMDNNRASLDLAGEDEVLPLVDLSDLFGLNKRTGVRCVVVVKAGMGQKAALVVDSAIGRQPLMVKPLDRFAENRYFSSASFADNELVLILNTPSLLAA